MDDYRRLPGGGESDKPRDGYDKAAKAADIRTLAHAFGAKQIHLVARDIGVMVAYAYAAQWPDEVARLVMLDVPVPGTRAWNEAKAKQDPQFWHFGLHQRRDIAELLIAGHETEYIFDFYKKRAYVSLAEEDIAVYARAYAAPGGLRVGFELYPTFPEDERRFKAFMASKLPLPVLALSGDRSNGMAELEMARELAQNVEGGVVPNTGHWTPPDENLDFFVEQLLHFLPEGKTGRGDGVAVASGVLGVTKAKCAF